MIAGGCYHGERATVDVNAAWQGRTRAEIESAWGTPARASATAAAWSFTTTHVELPSGAASVSLTPTSVDIAAIARPGVVEKTENFASAMFDASGTITQVTGPSLHWGPPREENMRWGTIFGIHVGMGRLDNTSTPLPSGGLYIGGMLGPRLGLVGQFSMVSGSDDAGGAIGFAWGMGLAYWPMTRLSVRAGPAAVLALDPGFANAGFGVGGNGAVSFAVIRTRVFVLDVRFDATIASSAAFGSLGVGVNVN